MDASRVFDLDETGITSGKDRDGGTRRKAIVPRGVRCHAKNVDFEKNLSRVSLIACVSATVDSILPLWIFKGKRLPYRVLSLSYGRNVWKSATILLPPDSLFATWPEVGGMDANIFIS